MKIRWTLICALICILFAQLINGQQRPKPKTGGAICGNMTAACTGREGFQPWDLPFTTGKNFVIWESAPFYGIVLKSVKLPDFGDCEHPSFKEDERIEIQSLFANNKVFAQNCVESGTLYYTGVADQTAFIGVYAGRTLAEANKFLKTVEALNRFPGIKVRRMKVGFNGT